MHPLHRHLLTEIKQLSGSPTQHTDSDTYLGTDHPRYPIGAPALRSLAKSFMKNYRGLTARELVSLLTSLIEGKSFTEKVLAGMLMDVAAAAQRDFPPNVFNRWLDHLQGWAEIDAVCTGSFTIEHVPERLDEWESWLVRFSKSKVIAKRRASLVILCSPVSHVKDGRLSDLAFRNILTLQNEKDVLITKAISWLLRSMIKHYGKEVKTFLMLNEGTLPKIAVRETRAKLETGLKTKRKDE